MYCTDDASVKTGEKVQIKRVQCHQRNLLSTTITDELRMATNFKGKVIGLSIKDRGAILPPDILLIGHFGIAQQVHLFYFLWFKFAKLGNGVQPRKRIYELY
jgi:hypothetical protein